MNGAVEKKKQAGIVYYIEERKGETKMKQNCNRLEEVKVEKVTGGISEWGNDHVVNGVNLDRCLGCGTCANNCPCFCISFDYGYAEIDVNSCLLCGNCADLCPTDAIDVNQIRAES